MLPRRVRWAAGTFIFPLSMLLALAVAAPVAANNPPGNDGTVKVDGLDFDRHPNNEPHVGCTFEVDFYGFDEGDLWADVTFEAHPPTGVAILLTDRVFIGEDDHSGGGSEPGWDASAEYDLKQALSAYPVHPQQGYHVKLTINTPESNGATVKHKVFWVEGCGPVTPTPSPTQTPTTPATSPSATPTTVTSALPSSTPAPETSSTQTPTPTEGPTTTPEPEVLGEQAFEEEKGDDVLAQQANQLLPTAVHAGVVGQPEDDRVVRTLLGLVLVLAGAASGRLVWLRRARG